jgi:5-methyltetrahydropteroyltriglutamate--homocysteine methyltransferase
MRTSDVIQTEPIGSVPRPIELVEATESGRDEAAAAALVDTLRRFEATGSPVISDGEQTKSSFVTYPIDNLSNIGPGGAVIPFADGHTRQLPKLVSGPFRYGRYADEFLVEALRLTETPVKQAVIAISALSLLYPAEPIDGYSREQFLDDLVAEGVTDIRRCLDAGAYKVQVDFTEGRLALKLDPSGELLRSFVALNNRVFDQFSEEECRRIGVHTCPGGDQDSTHSADVPYSDLLPDLFQMHVGNFYLQLASEPDRRAVLAIVKEHLPADAGVFIGVIDPIDPRVETAQEVRSPRHL